MIDEKEWNSLMTAIQELSEWFPDGLVMIGGVAVYLHSVRAQMDILEFSHDGDFYLSLRDYVDLREIAEVLPNKRLGKSQIIKNGFDFDIYVEQNHNLKIPYDEAVSESILINNIRCACLEHLLALKLAAYQDRRGSSKGDKDKRDLFKIVTLMTDPNKDLLKRCLDPDSLPLIEEAISDWGSILKIVDNNSFLASKIKKTCLENWESIKNAVQSDYRPG